MDDRFSRNGPYALPLTMPKALMQIRAFTGLRLSLIEKVALRQLVEDAIPRANAVIGAPDAFDPSVEAACRFMDIYYDTPLYTMPEACEIHRRRERLLLARGYDVVGEEFRQRQDEAHLI